MENFGVYAVMAIGYGIMLALMWGFLRGVSIMEDEDEIEGSKIQTLESETKN